MDTPAFTGFLQHCRVCLTNNAAERAVRGIALGRKAWLFCGSDRGGERAARMYSLIITAKLNDIDPQAWLADVLARISNIPPAGSTNCYPGTRGPQSTQGHRGLNAKRRIGGISELEKTHFTAACHQFIDSVLTPKSLPTIRSTDFNYPIDIHGKWLGDRYRFSQRYRSGFPENLGDEFDNAFTRLDWVSPDRFDIQWHRHIGA